MGRACSTNGEKRNAYKILVGKPGGKRLLEIPKRRWTNNNKIDLTEIEWDGTDWIDLARDRDQWRALVNIILNLRVPQNSWKFLSSCTTGGFSRGAQIYEGSE
jgi:hypothetical protein